MEEKAANEYFVDKNSIVRQIWGKSDCILFIFAGAAAEFALNKAVDWLYFTGRLPVDPLGRLFSTVSYAKAIVFSKKQAAFSAIDAMTNIHANVEAKRNQKIPDWAYQDVLFMLVDYSIRSFELLERKLTNDEKREVFSVFRRVGDRMGVVGLPETLEHFEGMRYDHLVSNLRHSEYTDDLFRQYRKHIGTLRYRILLEAQIMMLPQRARELLKFRRSSFLMPLLIVYKLARSIRFDWLLKKLILPAAYQSRIFALDEKKLSLH